MKTKTEIIEQLYKISWEIIQLLREYEPESLKSADRERIWNKYLNKRWGLFQELKKLPDKVDNLSYYDTHDVFWNILTRTGKKSFEEISYDELKLYLNVYLLGEPFVYDFHFRFGRSSEFPKGYKLGYGTMLPYDKLSEDFKERLKWNMRSDYHDNNEYESNFEDYEEFRKKNDNYMYIQVKALGNERARQKAYKLANRSHNILKLINAMKHYSVYDNTPIPPFHNYFYCKTFGVSGSVRSGEPDQRIFRWEQLDYLYLAITDMMTKAKPTELEERIVNAVDVYGMIDVNTTLHLSFLLCIISLEGLLLHEGEKDYLGWKLAEKITFLLGDSPVWFRVHYQLDPSKITTEFINTKRVEARSELYRKITDLYDKRSKFAHVGPEPEDQSKRITEQDYNSAFSILLWTIEKLIELANNRIEHIAKQDKIDEQSLDYHIQKLKYQ